MPPAPSPFISRSPIRSRPPSSPASFRRDSPSIRALAQQLQISVITTKRAYDELEKEGLIHTVASKGCFVAENNGPRIREERLRQLEAHVLAALELAPACGLSSEDVIDLFRLFAQELSAKE